MASFKEILNSSEEELLQLLYKFSVTEENDDDKIEAIAVKINYPAAS
ncbi:MAG: hypothetical protein O7D86_13100 [Proteobacteria bacterium]|nr:hypothetical protein [Pseudomonadota bacterium]